MPDSIVIDGDSLTLAQVLAVARHGAVVTLSDVAKQKIRRSRAVVEALLESGHRVYGLNTGFGSLRDVTIGLAHTRELQRNLVRSHACGVGDPAPVDAVRAMLLLRANTLAKGLSGVRLVLVEQILALLNKHVHPIVPVKGSVGASGDLAPLSHLALVLIGEGEASVGFESSVSRPRLSGAAALASVGLTPIELEAKEGLGLTNGTQFMTAIGALAFMDAEYVTRLAVRAATLSVEALQGVHRAFHPALHEARGHPGQIAVAAAMQSVLQKCNYSPLPVPNYAALRKVHAAVAKTADLLEEAADPDAEFARQTADSLDPDRMSDDTWSSLSSAPEALSAIVQLHLRLFENDDGRRFENSEGRFTDAQAAILTALTELPKVQPWEVPVQSDYSLRCTPQVLGAAWDTITHVRAVLTRELNAATDNPLIVPPDFGDCTEDEYVAHMQGLSVLDFQNAVLSGGNFHGAPVALALDQCCIAVASVASIAERRIFHIVTGHLSNGLPRFLAADPGLQYGLMLAQVTAASLVSENKTLCHPASVDSIPTVEDAEDHVSMGAFAARKFAEVVKNVQYVIAIELMCAVRGSLSRRPAVLAAANAALFQQVAEFYPSLASAVDGVLSPEIESVAAAIRGRRFDAAAL